MKKLCVFFTLLCVFWAACAYGADHYATTDMTWAEFYAGELGVSSSDLEVSYDAVSSATSNFAGRLTQLTSETVNAEAGAVVSSDGKVTKYYGVKAVQVRMTDDVYNALKDDKRYTFVDNAFTEYKDVDATGAFGAMVTESIDVSASCDVSITAPAVWGNYLINISGLNLASLDLKIASGEGRASTFDYYLGATLKTSDGKTYGMRHLNNLWVNTSELAFCIKDFREPHGNHPAFAHTADLEGKTITQIRYMLKDQSDVIINKNLFVKKQTNAIINAETEDLKTASSVQVKFVFTNADGYTLSGVTTGSGRNSQAVKDYEYSGGVLTLTNPAAGNYTATFSNNEYVDISATFTLSDYYATTDMTWAEFYAGETGKTASSLTAAGLDAVSSPTARIAGRFPQLTSESNDKGGRDITGVKDVQVRMTGAVYDALADKSRYTFTDKVFDEYKEVSADGSFGAMVTKTELQKDAVVTLSSGGSSTWGNYTLSLTSIDIAVTSGDDRLDLGALLQTGDGNIYGLRHNSNLWFNAGTIALSVQEFVEPHGVTRDYKYTSDLQGKTIKKITFMLKNKPDAVISCDVSIPKLSNASVTPEDIVLPGSSVPIKFTFENVPSEAKYEVSAVQKGSGRNRTPVNYNYSGNTLTITGNIAGTEVYRVIFSDASKQYSDIVANIEVFSPYATTDMTWAEFYAGETGQTSSALTSAGLDAITTPTTNALGRFPLVFGESNDSGTTISGLKAVQVHLAPEVYSALNDTSRYTFTGETFSEYKPVNANGTFGAMVTETVNAANAKVTIASGASSTWGHYTLTITSADIDIGLSGDKIARNYLGAYLETKSGKIYGLRHDNNLWSDAGSIAFCIADDYVEPHGRGVQRSWRYTSDLAGETITKITYMLKGLPDVVIPCEVTIPLMSNTKASLAENAKPVAGTGISIPFTFTGLPSGVTPDLISLYSGSGRNRTFITDYTFANNILTINSNITSGDYTAIFRLQGYSDISAQFEVLESSGGDIGDAAYHYATTDMTWAEFYAGETGLEAEALTAAGLDAVSSPTARIAGRFPQLTSESNDKGGRDITGVKDVQVRMTGAVYDALADKSRYKFTDEIFAEYKTLDESGAFGEMITEYEDAKDAVVTLSSGQNSTWGSYTLNISSIDVSLGSGDTRDYLGALITTSDGNVYGLRHNTNLWFNADTIALTYKVFTEPHGVARDYKYTSDLEGKTITKITYMLKNKPDVVVSCDVFLKLESPAKVTPSYTEGYHALLAEDGDAVTMTFSGLPSGVTYDLASVTPSIRHAAALESDKYSYADGKLTLYPPLAAGNYKVVFQSERYSDLAATVEVFTTDATDLIIEKDNNSADIFFLLTPKGYIDSVDEVLNANKFVNASDYTTIANNTTTNYTSGANEVFGSGFTFDIVLNNVSNDYTGIVGFGKMFTMTRQTLGSNYDAVFSAIDAIEIGESGWKEIPEFSDLNSAGLRVMQVMPDGTTRDISALTGTGAMIDGESIMLFYGVMAADSSTIAEDEYTLSPEGETLINDGARDGHIRVTIYIAATSDNTTPTNPGNTDNPTDNPSDVRKTTEISEPGFALTSTITSNILQALGQALGQLATGTHVDSLPDTASSRGSDRTIRDKEKNEILSSEEIAVVLQEIKVGTANVYVFGVSLDKSAAGTPIIPGTPIILHMTVDGVHPTEFIASESESEEIHMFLDDDGKETNVVPPNQHVNIAAYMEPNKTYLPIITTQADPGTPGGGCNSGFTMIYIAVLGLLAKRLHSN